MNLLSDYIVDGIIEEPLFPKMTIVNLVFNTTLGIEIDRTLLTLSLNAMFDSKIFEAVMSKCKEAGTNNMLFQRGSKIGAEFGIAGAKSIEQGLLSAYLTCRHINKYLLSSSSSSSLIKKANVYNFRLVNIVAHTRMPGDLDVDRFYQENSDTCGMIKEKFVGLNWNPRNEPRIAYQIFRTGKIVIVGLSELNNLIYAPKQMEKLKQYLLPINSTKPLHRNNNNKNILIKKTIKTNNGNKTKTLITSRSQHVTKKRKLSSAITVLNNEHTIEKVEYNEEEIKRIETYKKDVYLSQQLQNAIQKQKRNKPIQRSKRLTTNKTRTINTFINHNIS